MVAAPDTAIITAPENLPVSIGSALITTNGTQTTLGAAIGSGGTGTIAAGSLLGNSGTVAATPTAVAIGTNLTLAAGTLTASAGSGTVTQIIAGAGLAGGTITNSGTVSLGTIAAGDLLGNSGSVAAVPTAIAIGANLTLAAGTLSASAGGGGIGTIIAGGISNTASSQAIAAVPYSLPTFTTWLNQGTAVATVNANGPIVLSLATPAAANNIRSRYMALGAGDFSLTMQAAMFQGPDATNCPTFGPILTDGTKTAIFALAYSRATPIATGHVWNNVTTLSTSLFGSDIAYGHLPPRLWQRISLSGTTYTCSLSMDGFAFNQVGPTFTAATVGFTPTGIGIGLEESSTSAGTGPFSMSLNYWLKTP